MRHDGGAAHKIVDPGTLFLKVGQELAGQPSFPGHLDRHGVDRTIIDEDFVVQMGSGYEAGRANEANDLALAHLGTL